jgi:hypothetical protein
VGTGMNSISAFPLEFAEESVDDKEFYDAERRWYMVRNPNIKRYICFWRLRQGKGSTLEKLLLWPENTMYIYLCIAQCDESNK